MFNWSVFAPLYRAATPIELDAVCVFQGLPFGTWKVIALNKHLIAEFGRLKKKFTEAGTDV